MNLGDLRVYAVKVAPNFVERQIEQWRTAGVDLSEQSWNYNVLKDPHTRLFPDEGVDILNGYLTQGEFRIAIDPRREKIQKIIDDPKSIDIFTKEEIVDLCISINDSISAIRIEGLSELSENEKYNRILIFLETLVEDALQIFQDKDIV